MSGSLLAIFILLTVAWAVITFLLWRKRRWLMFYLFGALGFVLLVMYAAAFMGFDDAVEAVEAAQVAVMASAVGITMDVMGTAGLAVRNHAGWAVFDIGIECSALLEIAAVTALVAFYPAFSWRRKAVTIVIGVVATYILNLFRILLIVWIIDMLGTGWVFPAHAVFGRLFFFVGTVFIYWYLVTRPSIGILGNRMKPGDVNG
jgi:exosortase family protein XrtG